MGDVIPIGEKEGRYEVTYIFDDDVGSKKVVGVTHLDWPFRIMRVGDKVAMVCEDTDEPFGELDYDVFDTLLMCWLLIDSPHLIDGGIEDG